MPTKVIWLKLKGEASCLEVLLAELRTMVAIAGPLLEMHEIEKKDPEITTSSKLKST